MQPVRLSDAIKVIISLAIMGYFVVLASTTALAKTSAEIKEVKNTAIYNNQGYRTVQNTAIYNDIPVSVPVTIPVPIPVPTPTMPPVILLGTPEMVYPVNGQTLDLEGAYMFKVRPVAGASGYLFGLFQDGVMVYENWRDTKQLSPNGEFALLENNPAHARFHAGPMKVMIRALVYGRWTDAREITLNLRPRSVLPTPTPRPTTIPVPTPRPIPTSVPGVTSVTSTSPAPIQAKVVAITRSKASPTPQTMVVPPISVNPSTLRAGRLFTITGKSLGTAGRVNFYRTGSSIPNTATIYYWSNSIIVGWVPNNLKSNGTYGIQVQTTRGGTGTNSLVYRYISR